ncbi:MAG: tRNA (adenosine(37)-N6)-threonylcarbamoyltransferase complex transferase subunit TsaD [Cyclobacteriaceae bacterium]
MSIILAIESSCDETSAAVIVNGVVKSNSIATQSIHKGYGGVVPELASRAHQQHIIPVVMNALSVAKVAKKDLKAVAFTQGPGLLGALLVGSSFAKSLAFSLKIPLIGVQHMQAHVLAHFIDDPKPEFPFLCLTVSGGHTQLVLVRDFLEMEIIGQTKDDAVGEAFDKCAKMLGFDYPGGPLIDKYARKGEPLKFTFGETDMPNLDYSFSGIKTGFLYFLRDKKKLDPNFIENNLEDLCASLQHTLIEMLIHKLQYAVKETGVKHVAIAGGVSANSGLRDRIVQLGKEINCEVYIPKFEYCTDNAAMIAITAHYKYLNGDFLSLDAAPLPRMQF